MVMMCGCGVAWCPQILAPAEILVSSHSKGSGAPREQQNSWANQSLWQGSIMKWQGRHRHQWMVQKLAQFENAGKACPTPGLYEGCMMSRRRHIVPSPRSTGVLSRWPEWASVQRSNQESCHQKWVISFEPRLMYREEARFSEHEYRSEMVKGSWILGPGGQTRAPEVSPPAGQDWDVRTWLGWAWLEVRWYHWDLGREAEAGNQSQGWVSPCVAPLLSRVLWPGPASCPCRGGGSQHIPLPSWPRFFSSSPLLSFRRSQQRFGVK